MGLQIATWEGGLETLTDCAAVEVHRGVRVYGIVPSVVSPSADGEVGCGVGAAAAAEAVCPDPPVSRSLPAPPPDVCRAGA